VANIVVSTLFTKREFLDDRRIRVAVNGPLHVTKLQRLQATLAAYRKHERKLKRKLEQAKKEIVRTKQAISDELVRTVIVGQFPELLDVDENIVVYRTETRTEPDPEDSETDSDLYEWEACFD
jgi:hypothetical protein